MTQTLEQIEHTPARDGWSRDPDGVLRMPELRAFHLFGALKHDRAHAPGFALNLIIRPGNGLRGIPHGQRHRDGGGALKGARIVWYQLCNTTHGVDSNGDEVASLTDLGILARSHGAPTGYSELARPDKRKDLATFLREFADAVEANE